MLDILVIGEKVAVTVSDQLAKLLNRLCQLAMLDSNYVHLSQLEIPKCRLLTIMDSVK